MKLPNRTISIFSMSALDLFAMTMGVFVLIAVVLMPYYRRQFDAQAAIEEIRVETAELRSERDALDRKAVAEGERAGLLESRAEARRRAMREARAETERLLLEARLAQNEAGKTKKKLDRFDSITRRRIARELDLVFVLDTTGSMGPAIDDLSRNLGGIIKVMERLVPSLRVGVVAYRDFDTDGYVTQVIPLTATGGSGIGTLLGFTADLTFARRGGSSATEAVHEGLKKAVSMRFRDSADQIIVLIGDAAAPRRNRPEAIALVRDFHDGDPRRTLSSVFVKTRVFLLEGTDDDDWFERLAATGGGRSIDHRGRMIESVLLSVLK